MGLCACALLLLTLSALGGCATGKPAEEPPPGDDRLERTSRVALIAFQQGRYASAATLYGQVANLAYERDDVEAAVDAQYNAAVCLVRLDRVDDIVQVAWLRLDDIDVLEIILNAES